MDTNPQKGDMEVGARNDADQKAVMLKQGAELVSLTEDIGNSEELKQRIKERKEILLKADMVVIMVGCDDGRVDAPEELVVVSIGGQDKKVAMIYLPQIGGGMPAEAHMKGVIEELVAIGVDREKIQVWLSQHGSTAEFDDESEKETCGARGVVGELEKNQGDWWSSLKKFISDNTFPSYSGFIQSSDLAGYSELNNKLNELAEASHVPPRLLFLLAKTMGSSEIRENANFVKNAVTSYPSMAGIPVHSVYFDQNQFVVSPIDEVNANFESVTLPFESGHDTYYQDPSTIVLLVGSEMVTLGAGVVLAKSVGGQGIDNDFTASALGELDEELSESIFDALAQQMYAVVHHLEAKKAQGAHDGHHHSFEHLQSFRVLCSNQAQANIIQQVIDSDEFNEYYSSSLQAADLKIEVIVVDTETGSFKVN